MLVMTSLWHVIGLTVSAGSLSATRLMYTSEITKHASLQGMCWRMRDKYRAMLTFGAPRAWKHVGHPAVAAAGQPPSLLSAAAVAKEMSTAPEPKTSWSPALTREVASIELPCAQLLFSLS
eukprot:CAMPEP_0171105802 /NCGR_PEP_ID=MMETSP0766_2-20121228/63477_1 /TAXON_ID=439317 /ORGANISM="Gambierdiscus australes, Strain CAWD 149" /LENGTH=120 /DNA_ID=CAMNT_0011566749 /DNA_START=229 /DNA_END=587 /DNA_ORIENTATION=-